MTPDQHERLSMLLEEAGEVVQICGKILRNGYDSYNPFDENKTTNKDLLEKELTDLYVIMDKMNAYYDINLDLNQARLDKIWKKKLKWTHNQNT